MSFMRCLYERFYSPLHAVANKIVRTNKHSIQMLIYTYSIVYVYIDIIAHTSTNEFGHIHTNPQHQECYVDEML